MPFPKGKSRGSGFHRTLFGEGARPGRDARAWSFIATVAGIFRRAGFFHGVRAMTAPLLGLPLEELAFEMESIGEKPYRAKQLFHWFYLRYETDFDKMTDLAKDLRSKLISAYAPVLPAVERITESRVDASKKYLFRYEDGEPAEAVWMAHDDRITLCLSTQTGCALGCAFCLTGKRPGRNLLPREMLGQFLHLARGHEAQRVNIVFMGMGEPLLNLENLAATLPFLYASISPRRITVSTAGLLKGIEALGRVQPPPRLALSLNAGTNATRHRLMPVHAYSMDDLLNAVDAYPRGARDRVTLEYVLIKGVTDTPEEIAALKELLRTRRSWVKVNLIPFNPVPGMDFDEPSVARVDAIGRELARERFTVTVRRSLGRDILAACGQLAAEKK